MKPIVSVEEPPAATRSDHTSKRLRGDFARHPNPAKPRTVLALRGASGRFSGWDR